MKEISIPKLIRNLRNFRRKPNRSSIKPIFAYATLPALSKPLFKIYTHSNRISVNNFIYPSSLHYILRALEAVLKFWTNRQSSAPRIIAAPIILNYWTETECLFLFMAQEVLWPRGGTRTGGGRGDSPSLRMYIRWQNLLRDYLAKSFYRRRKLKRQPGPFDRS